MVVKIGVRALISRVENITKIQDTDPGDVELHKARSFRAKITRSIAVL